MPRPGVAVSVRNGVEESIPVSMMPILIPPPALAKLWDSAADASAAATASIWAGATSIAAW